MDTTVITVEPKDYGLGSSNRTTLVDTKYKIDERGDLHVYRDNDGNVGSFPAGCWSAVIRGGSIAFNGDDEATEVGK